MQRKQYSLRLVLSCPPTANVSRASGSYFRNSHGILWTGFLRRPRDQCSGIQFASARGRGGLGATAEGRMEAGKIE